MIAVRVALSRHPGRAGLGHTGRGVFAVAGLAKALRAVPAFGLIILLSCWVTPKIHYHGGRMAGAPRARCLLIPVEAMLVVLAIPPILVNTYAGVQGVDPAARDAARGMGMTGWQVVTSVEFPCALPLILAGVRSAVLQVIATATIAGYLPFLGGLGTFHHRRLPQINNPQVGYPAMLGAAVVVAALAVVAESLLWACSARRLPGLTGRFRQVKRGARPRPGVAEVAQATPESRRYPLTEHDSQGEP